MGSGHLLLSGDGFRVRVRVLDYGFGVRGRKVKSRDCALASDLVKANPNPNEQLKFVHQFAAHWSRDLEKTVFRL